VDDEGEAYDRSLIRSKRPRTLLLSLRFSPSPSPIPESIQLLGFAWQKRPVDLPFSFSLSLSPMTTSGLYEAAYFFPVVIVVDGYCCCVPLE
jgi:hypothetical protein